MNFHQVDVWLLLLLLLMMMLLLLLLRWNIAQGGSLLMMMRVALWLHDAWPRVTPQTNQMLVLFRVAHGLCRCQPTHART